MMSLRPHNNPIRNDLSDLMQNDLDLDMKGDFIDVMDMFGLDEPLNPKDLPNMFRPLVKKIYKKIDAEWYNKYRSMNKATFNKFWKPQFENLQQMRVHCNKWIDSLKEKIPNGQYPAIDCLLSFNQVIVGFIANNSGLPKTHRHRSYLDDAWTGQQASKLKKKKLPKMPIREIIDLDNKEPIASSKPNHFNNAYLDHLQASKLRVNDLIDHQSYDGLFGVAEVIDKKGTNLKIHYHGWANKYDVWSDYNKELHRFAHPRSISGRARHRLQQLQNGDLISLFYENEWISAKVILFDSKQSGQVRVRFRTSNSKKIYKWVHLDNEKEVRPLAATKVNKMSERKRKRKMIEIIDSDCDNDDDKKSVNENQPLSKKKKLNGGPFVPQRIHSETIQMKEMRQNSEKMKQIQADNIRKSKELKSLQQKYDDLNRQNEENKRELSLFHGDSQRMSSMNLQELDALDMKLQNASKKLRNARERLLENRLNCIVCLDSPKNIVIQPCGHFDMCKQCEESLESKICPRCQRPFHNVTVINH